MTDKNSNATDQIIRCVELLMSVLEKQLLGVFLYGSAIAGGLQKYSDLDLLVVINRATTEEEKKKLIIGLLQISGIYMKSETRPIELTIIVEPNVNPWRYPPTFDFQYGEWLRDQFENGNMEPWPTKEMPDLAILITQVLLANKKLYGADAAMLLPSVPYRDFILATADSVNHLIAELHSDTRNVLLTLARIWNTVSTDTICPKPAAASWAIEYLPDEFKPVLARAKAICMGETAEYWDDLATLIQPCANFMLHKIHNQIDLINKSDCNHKSIHLDNTVIS